MQEMDRQWFRFMKKTLEFLVVVSFSCFLCSYFPGFPFTFSEDLQFSTLIFSVFGHALDRKYMFLVCNGILAFLAKNLNFGSSSLNCGGVIKNDDEDGVKQFIELPAVLEEEIVEENVASVEYAVSSSDDMAVAEAEETAQKQDGDHGGVDKEMKMEEIVLDSEVDDEDQDEGDGLFEGNKASEVNDASVSTEELNQKFEEFIRKMKEEIRIEAQQQLIVV